MSVASSQYNRDESLLSKETMPRPGGNPEFGTKYRFDYGRDKPLSAQVKAQVLPETKQQLKNLADEQKCTVPDIIRAAIDEYLEKNVKN
ncbi:MAG: CopG family transcriptional regulator [Crocosphaera sp.]